MDEYFHTYSETSLRKTEQFVNKNALLILVLFG